MTNCPDVQSTQDALPETPEQSDDVPLPALKLNPDRYREHLSTFDLSDDQQNELMLILWNIMTTLVDIGWGVDTVQYFLPEIFENSSSDSGKLLQQIYSPAFNDIASIHSETKDDSDDTE